MKIRIHIAPSFLVLFLIIFGLPALHGQGHKNEELKTILKKTSKNISNINSVYYKITYRNRDERDNKPLIMKAGVYFKKLNDKDEIGVQTKIVGRRILKDEALPFQLYYNGKKEILVDPNGKQIKVFNRPAMLTGNVIGRLIKTVFISQKPFENTLKRITDYEMKEAVKIDDDPCYVFTLFLPDTKYLNDISDTWYISKSDYLPRKHIGRYSYNGKKRITTMIFKDLQVNPDLPDSLFTMRSFPEGYEVERPEDRANKKKPELLKKGRKAPAWTLKNGKGEDVSLNKYRGQIIILDFWGTWCPPCLKAMPELEHIYGKYDQITVIGISTNEPANAEPVKFARNIGVSYPILLNGEKIINDYNVSSFPTFYIIDKDGKVIYHAEGYNENSRQLIEKVLKENGLFKTL